MKRKYLAYCKKPQFLQLELTYACNENCLFCYNPARVKAKIDAGRIFKLVDAVCQERIPHVQLTGGEVSLLGVDFLNGLIDRLAKTSVVSIVTNALVTLKGLSKNVSVIFVSLHGTRNTHEKLTRRSGGWEKTIEAIKHYVNQGFSVTSDTIMTCMNYSEIPYVVKLAKKLGMRAVMINRFEDGGLGSLNRDLLRPNLKQFKEALTLMIESRDNYKMPIGFGTAIPFCLDSRLVAEGLAADCGAGVGFAAVDPLGNLRICNQSNRSYGNILEEPISVIWNKRDLDDFRCLSWVTEPCSNCPSLCTCCAGCKVDASQPETYCPDYAVREIVAKTKKGSSWPPKAGRETRRTVDAAYQGYIPLSHPPNYRVFKIGSEAQLSGNSLRIRQHKFSLDKSVWEICKLLFNSEAREASLVRHFANIAEESEVRKFCSQLLSIGGLEINGFEKRRKMND